MFDSALAGIQAGLAILVMMVSTVSPFVLLWFLNPFSTQRNYKVLKPKFGTLYSAYTDSPPCRNYLMFFAMRRFIFCLSIVALKDMPLV